MNFLADMNVDWRIVVWLRERGHDATHLRDQGLQRMQDVNIFAKAQREKRIVVTFDLDFGEIAAATSGKPASVILFRLQNTRTSFVIQRLAPLLESETAKLALANGAVVVVEDSRYRIRELPIGKPSGNE